jgi:hypothetical protein
VGVGGQVLELVVFKLGDGVSREQFLAASDAVSVWLSTRPGFVSRDLVYDREGDRWVDVVWWETLREARAAAELATTSETCKPMFALIDEESTLMLHGQQALPPVRASD